MRLGILKAGTASTGALARDGDYDRMFVNLLAAPGREFQSYDVEHSEFPGRLEEQDLYLLTGSRYSAYDDVPWITQLLDTLRELEARGIDVLGVIDHGICLSIYFFDPNGIRLELAYWVRSPNDGDAKAARVALASWEKERDLAGARS